MAEPVLGFRPGCRAGRDVPVLRVLASITGFGISSGGGRLPGPAGPHDEPSMPRAIGGTHEWNRGTSLQSGLRPRTTWAKEISGTSPSDMASQVFLPFGCPFERIDGRCICLLLLRLSTSPSRGRGLPGRRGARPCVGKCRGPAAGSVLVGLLRSAATEGGCAVAEPAAARPGGGPAVGIQRELELA